MSIKEMIPEPILRLCRCIRHPRRSLQKYRRIEAVRHARLTPLPACGDGRREVVVSLTSYGARLMSVHLAIRSIILQSVLPNRVVLYLDSSISEEDLPQELLELSDCGLEIRLGCEDLRPHKKWYYAFQEFPDALVITIDDDVIYPEDTVECLMRSHEEFPHAVAARRARLMGFAGRDRLLPYSEWIADYRDPTPRPRCSLVAVGVGGTLYPVSDFDPAAIDIDVIRSEALYADDIYLKVLETVCGIPVVYAPSSLSHPYTIPGTQEDALCEANVAGHRNDAVLEALLRRYSLTAGDFMDEE